MSKGLKIPDGLEIDWNRDGRHLVLTRQVDHHKGSVTIDLHDRRFRGGITFSGPSESVTQYSGRGWRQRICDDAVEWLLEVMGS